MPSRRCIPPFPLFLSPGVFVKMFSGGERRKIPRTDAKNNVTRGRPRDRGNPNGKLKGGCSRFPILLHSRGRGHVRESSYFEEQGKKASYDVEGKKGTTLRGGRSGRKETEERWRGGRRGGLIRMPIAIKKALHLISIVKKRRVRSLRIRIRELQQPTLTLPQPLEIPRFRRSSSRTR